MGTYQGECSECGVVRVGEAVDYCVEAIAALDVIVDAYCDKVSLVRRQ